VEAVIAERITRLPPQLQDTLALASVEGETFVAEVIARANSADPALVSKQLSAELDRRHNLVRALGVNHIGEIHLSRYQFRHILFQKYLYSQLDAVERTNMHLAVGGFLEELFSGYPEGILEIAGQLARHFEEGGSLEKAVVYLLQAGTRATKLYANEEAVAHFKRGLELVAELPQNPDRDKQELALQVGLAVPSLAIKGFSAPEVAQTYKRALELCHYVEGTPQHFQVLWLSYSFYAAGGQHQKAYAFGEQLLDIAQRTEDPIFTAQAHWALGWSLFNLGKLSLANEHMQTAITFYKQESHHSLTYLYGQDPSSTTRIQYSMLLWIMGYPEEAQSVCQEAVAIAQSLKHPFSIAFVLGLCSLLHSFCIDPHAAQESAEACIQLSSEHGFVYFLSTAQCFLGWALVENGQFEEGITLIQEGTELYKATGSEMGYPQQLAMLANAYGMTGRAKHGLKLLEQALAVVERNDERCTEAEIHRLKGELLLKICDDNADDEQTKQDAEACFQRAVKIARAQEAKMWELRATVSLARLWLQQGRHQESRQILGGIYGWFTEGFETADLHAAKMLLDELAVHRV
jgi:predicted ATPase